ncbi:MAG: MogA/MoaB family molybdenum cofactor biosynthesis protein [Phycisphaerae bacterium]|jgi:molybdopterin adenylyltransferase|nr:MogA/MoaB family molybdenum cofactor biosynthesis protein [Phycisphaerae bacterium]|tara:strand:- start:538 stop:1053 length:516 start_codon:yes stop_codon:yes gene_type:complete
MPHQPSDTKAEIAVLTVSDTRSLETDSSGQKIVELLHASGHTVSQREIVRDEPDEIATMVSGWAKERNIQVIIVTGGTGPSQRDITPDTLAPMFTTQLPGFGELFRYLSFKEIGSASMLSRAVGGWMDVDGTRKPMFVIPGSPKAVELALTQIIIPELGHLLDVCSVGVKP